MKTPLYAEHQKLKARIVDFHGWDMPVWYSGIKQEHLATRSGAGLFDVSHMGEIRVQGKESVPFLDRILTRSIPDIQQGKVRYGFALNETGGIIDDLTIYCVRSGVEYLLCVNASNTAEVFSWMEQHNREGAELSDISSETALLALQGPQADTILSRVLEIDKWDHHPFTFTRYDSRAFGKLMVSQTGYTGAGGIEIFMDPHSVVPLWNALISLGAAPCGLGARDTLRLEMGYPLHGNDIDSTITPFEAGLGFAVDMKKADFLGKNALETVLSGGLTRRLTGLEMLEKGVPRHGCPCLKDDQQVGYVSSGSISPILDIGIALCYLENSVREGEEITVSIRERRCRARVKTPPFVAGTV
ncbi:MAG TPA: glycine cleavage system aminomethyltransferase GcvT [Deltaproteobacteria bacterium]|nr:glycine cleavage system aminomethyltransferase GcvT [Deltaproteobacteria bacterium]